MSADTSSLHGTRSRYNTGCRCDKCRAANADYIRKKAGREEDGFEPEPLDPQIGRGWTLIHDEDLAREAEFKRWAGKRPCFVCSAPFLPMDTSIEGDLPCAICADCGSRKRQAALERRGWADLLERYLNRVLAAPSTPRPVLEPPLIDDGAVEAPELEELEDLDDVVIDFKPQPKAEPMSSPKESLCNKGCGRALRSNNTRGFCGYNCAGKPATGVKTAPRERAAAKEVRVSEKVRVPAEAGEDLVVVKEEVVRSSDRVTVPADVDSRFNVVVDVLGLDRDEVLLELMAGWLEGLKAKLRPGEGSPP